MCNLGSLPTHVKSQLADPIGFKPGQPGIPGGSYEARSESNPGGKPVWATGISSMVNYSLHAVNENGQAGYGTGDGGVCSTEKDSYGNAYPLISCKGLLRSADSSVAGEQRYMKGTQASEDSLCVNEFAGIRASNPTAASDHGGWIDDTQADWQTATNGPRGNNKCERMACNKTPCVGRGANGYKTGAGVAPSAGQEYGTKLTDGTGGVSCTPCTTASGATISIGGDWSKADGHSLARANCSQYADATTKKYTACNCTDSDSCDTGTYIDCGGCFWPWQQRGVCVDWESAPSCPSGDWAGISGDGG
tara:strand:- start:17019 stop:17936 length:918 start_codon:yes stop_codon:yes gene_type:complete